MTMTMSIRIFSRIKKSSSRRSPAVLQASSLWASSPLTTTWATRGCMEQLDGLQQQQKRYLGGGADVADVLVYYQAATSLFAATSVALGASYYTLRKELQKTKFENVNLVHANATLTDKYEKVDKELQETKFEYVNLVRDNATLTNMYEQVGKELQETKSKNATLTDDLDARQRKDEKLRDSIQTRGQMGEKRLENVLTEAKRRGYINSFQLQPTLPTLGDKGRPDAVVDFAGDGRLCWAIDSKAPSEDLLIGTTNNREEIEKKRKEYVKKIRGRVNELSNRNYTAGLLVQPNADGSFHDITTTASALPYPRTWMFLPGEGYVSATYDSEGRDSEGIHAYARTQDVLILGPESLMSLLYTMSILFEKDKDLSFLPDRAKALESLIVTFDKLIQTNFHEQGQSLQEQVTRYNQSVGPFNTFHSDLRNLYDLELKASKTKQLKAISEPSVPHKDDF